MSKRAFERLIGYAQYHTTSDGAGEKTPSTARQFYLARLLESELKALGASDVLTDGHCYVYARFPATPGLENRTPIGFLAHLDTSPDFPGKGVHPRVVERYDGGDLALGDSGRVLRPAEFPHLRALAGKTLIVTDGATLLGADDKAGIAEIMTAAERLVSERVPHGPVSLAFCPDEEIGHGAALLDLERFGAELAYTVDGGALGELEYENFNAAEAEIAIRGFNVHPGSAKNVMVNAALAAAELLARLPAGETPRETEGYEGFFHLTELSGTVERAKLSLLIRDHDAQRFEERKQCLEGAVRALNQKYGPETASMTVRDQYRNMAEVVRKRFEVVEVAQEAYRAMGIEARTVPIRGGTDGAQLSFRGLPCPNLPTGSWAHHGPYEHACAEDMDRCAELILNIIRAFAARGRL